MYMFWEYHIKAWDLYNNNMRLSVHGGKYIPDENKISTIYIIYIHTLGRGTSEWVSEWVLLNGNSTILQLYHGDNKFIFNEVMMRSVLHLINTRKWIFIVLAHWHNSPWIDMMPHSDTLFWFRDNKSLFCLLNAAWLAESNKYKFNSIWFYPIGGRTHYYRLRG